MLRPAGLKVEARRAEAKFWVWSILSGNGSELDFGSPRVAEVNRKGEARRAEPTCHSVYAEARTAEGRGPKGRGEILGVVNLLGNGSEADSGSP